MKGIIPVIIFATTLQIFILYAESYNFKCPEQANWKFRAIEKCNSTLKYFCLYNNVYRKYVEGCTGPDWDRKGNKRIYVGDFTREKCIQKRFQPFKFWTNESTSDCIYTKSICSEEGQLIFNDNSTKDDRTCRCNYKRNYSFVATPRNVCFCIPTEEDCSCHIKSCPVNLILSADYECIRNDFQESSKCIDLTKYYVTLDENTETVKDHWLSGKNNDTENANLKKKIERTDTDVHEPLHFGNCSFNMFKKTRKRIGAVLSEPVQFDLDETFVEPKELNTVDTVDGKNQESFRRTSLDKEQTDQTTVMEVNCLRMIHLLFRVVCPVVRTFFDYEIEPKQLRNIVNNNQAILRKQYRQKDNIFNDAQWNLLFRKTKGKTVSFTSDDFDVRLMIYLLKTITKVDVGDLYPLKVDISTSAMLSRIKFIRNETTQSIEGKLSEVQYNKFWDDIGQAVFKLVSSHSIYNINDERNKQLIDRLTTLNPINIDNDKLCTFIVKSEIYPAMILRQFISEYCASKYITIDQLLRQETHNLYHMREKTGKCCSCENDKFATYVKLLPEKQWLALYELTDCINNQSRHCESKKCCKLYFPKKRLELDLSVLVSLVLYIPEILERFISHFSEKKFEQFLIYNKHIIYHSMEKTRCCKCENDPTEKKILHEKDWNTLFIRCDQTTCTTGNDDCYCQYSVRKEIKTTSMDSILRCKIFDIAGALSDINKIEQDAFSYFLNWTVCDRPIQRMLTDLLCAISTENIEFAKMSKDLFSSSLSEVVEASTKRIDVAKWIDTHIHEQNMQKNTLAPSLFMLVRNKECMKVKRMQIPSDFDLSDRARKFEDITPEENNFLVVFHTLKKIVHPVITNQLNKHCPEKKLLQILKEIYYGRHNENTNGDDNPKKLDLKLMIYILTQEDIVTVDHQNEWKEQLQVINEIRREIMQSSSGILEGKEFQDVMKSISEAVLFLGGEEYREDLTELSNNKNILDWIKKTNMAKTEYSDVSTTFPNRVASCNPETSVTTVTSETSIPTPTSMCNIPTMNPTSATSSVIPTTIHLADTNN
ncbi:unnamed protein product [Mytilus coruscus]|uniref:DZIP3-like HEPN domain-containing protein n=1 Tax=Mytilus coruscus TaxID=42192 RepID=A0A6J8D9I4_MYTCO|nr:unnamed protein product [Mytilus coruscus]